MTRRIVPDTTARAHTMLATSLMRRESLDGIDSVGLAQSHGLPIGEVLAKVSAEHRRREVL